MTQLRQVVGIEYRGAFVYRVTFDDGTTGDVDFSEWLGLGPVFAPLREIAYFRRARVEGGTIVWPNGADIAPETLYDRVRAEAEQDAPVARDKPRAT